MKLSGKIIVSLVLLAFTANLALAIEGGNPKKGKYLFKKNCKVCHEDGAAGGKITPLSKTMKQWDRFFDKKQHDPAAWKDIDDKQMKDINQFLFNHAKDSDQPQTCG
ncbi:MAG: cytochrome c [Desulfuromonadaceae bacterium]|nr:cytochrome c [Desulfuromonadaceae bacterium]